MLQPQENTMRGNFLFQPSVTDLQNPNHNGANSHRHNPSFDVINLAANNAQNVVFADNNMRQQASMEQMMGITSPTFQGLEHQPPSNSRKENIYQTHGLGHGQQDYFSQGPIPGLALTEQMTSEQENSTALANNQSF